MFNPLINPMISPKPIPKIVQVGIVTNHGEPLDEDEDYSDKKHIFRMSQIIPTKKLYHDQRGGPFPIGDVGRLLTNG
jgi:hypothetical protein